jgi:hypothetical protein
MALIKQMREAWSRPGADRVFAIVLPMVLLLPFLGRAFHMDDSLFMWTARHIMTEPLDFYGFDVNWYGLVQPMHEVNMNPPGVAYWLALAGSLLGWSEPALHGAMLLPAAALSLGVCELARRTGAHTWVAVTALIACPVFLTTAGSVMTDIPMTACYVWAVVLWHDAHTRGGAWRFTGAGLLAAAAVMFKYFGITLVPLLLFHGLALRRRPGPWMAALLIPVAVTALFEAWAHHLYGHGLFLNSAAYASGSSGEGNLTPAVRLLVGLAFLGGTCLPALTTFPLTMKRRGAAIALALAGAVLLVSAGVGWADRFAGHALPDTVALRAGYALQAGLMTVTGLLVFAVTGAACLRRRDPDALLLALWVAGTFVFAVFLNWTVNARTLLPLAPALAVVLGMCAARTPRPRLWAAALAVPLAVSLAVAVADASLANAGRRAARALIEQKTDTPLWYQGHWGFQYYLDDSPARPVDFYNDTIPAGAVMAVPLNNTNVYPLHPDMAEKTDTWQFAVLPWLTVHSVPDGAGFHSAAYGPLPYVFGPVTPERHDLYRVTATITPP